MKKLDKLAKILEGISSLICLYPSENKRKITLPDSSIHGVLKKDWENIGMDLWKIYNGIDSKSLEINLYKDRNDRFEGPSAHQR